MARPTLPAWRSWWPLPAWLMLLAWLPWWLGGPLLLALAIVLMLLQYRLLGAHASVIRHALRWGLPGILWSLQRALGGDAFAWGAALLGALVGYTLLAGLEAWLDRGQPRAPSNNEQGEWPDLAMAPVGPPAEIIELQLPVWWPKGEVPSDARATGIACQDGIYQVDDTRIADAGSHACVDPQCGWFALWIDNDRTVVLLDRAHAKLHRMRGWQLAGWHGGQPWLMRREGDMPVSLQTLLGDDDRGIFRHAG
jgi:hypothetical protein